MIDVAAEAEAAAVGAGAAEEVDEGVGRRGHQRRAVMLANASPSRVEPWC